MQFECWISQRHRDSKSRKGGPDSADEHGFVLRSGDNEAADEHLVLRQHAGPGRDVEERLRRVELRRVVSSAVARTTSAPSSPPGPTAAAISTLPLGSSVAVW